MIKKIIIASVVVVLLTGSLIAVDWHFRQTTQKKRQAENTAVQNTLKDISTKVSTLKLDVANVKAESARLLAECQKGKVAYDALPAVTKTKITAPVCTAV